MHTKSKDLNMEKNRKKNGKQKSDKDEYLFFGTHAKNAIAVLVFIFFLSVALRADSWENSYRLGWVPDSEVKTYNFGSPRHLAFGVNVDDNLDPSDYDPNLSEEELTFLGNNNDYEDYSEGYWKSFSNEDDDKYDLDESQNVFPQFMIEPLGHNKSRLEDYEYPLLFFHDTSEYNVMEIQNFTAQEPFSPISENLFHYLSFKDILRNYGKSMFGSYSVGKLPGEDVPGMLWNVSYENRQMNSWCIVPDMNKDGINEMFVSLAKTPELPQFGSGFAYDDPEDFFFNYDDETNEMVIDEAHFSDFFRLSTPTDVFSGEDSQVRGILESRVEYYQNMIFSGKGTAQGSESVLVPDRQESSDFARENVLQAIFNMNKSGSTLNQIDGNILLLTSSSPMSKMDYYGNYHESQELTHALKSYNKNGSLMWEKNLRTDPKLKFQVDNNDFEEITQKLYFDLRDAAAPIHIRPLDNGLFVISCTASHLIDENNNERSIDQWNGLSMNYVMNASNGEIVWSCRGDLHFNEDSWFNKLTTSNNTKINDNVFCTTRKRNDDGGLSLLIKKMNCTSGEPLAQFNYNLSVSQPNLVYSDFSVSDENYYGFDNREELVGIISQDGGEISEVNSEFLRMEITLGGTTIIRKALQMVEGNGIEDYEDQETEEGKFLHQMRDWGLESYNIVPIHCDIDRDKVNDYYVRLSNNIYLLSGLGSDLNSREFTSLIGRKGFDTYISLPEQKTNPDLLSVDDLLHIFPDPKNELRISSFYSDYGNAYYIEDINNFKQDLSFDECFSRISLYLNIAIAAIALLCIFVIWRDTEKLPEAPPDKAPKLTKFSKMLLITTFILFLVIVIFFFSLDLNPRTTDIFVSRNASIYWFFIIYPLTFILVAAIPPVYNFVAPYFAEILYLKLQKLFFSWKVKTGAKDYEVLVMDMKVRDYMPTRKYIFRSTLPFLIGLTIGISVYTGLADGGWLLNIVRSFNQGTPPLTNPENLGIWETGADFSSVWVEMGKYARYMVLGLLLSFIPSSILIAPAWLLDDAGVVYYVRWNKYRGVNDIDSVSSWFLNFLEGVFGLTAITSWLSLFLPMLSNLGRLEAGLSQLRGVSSIFGVIVIFVALILFPLLATISIINSCNQKMEQNVVKNSSKLFAIMEKKDYDLIPKDIENILHTKDKKRKGPWTSYENEIGLEIREQNIPYENDMFSKTPSIENKEEDVN